MSADQKILARVRKLAALALDGGATEDEARTAWAEALRLARKHGVRLEVEGERPQPRRSAPRPDPPPAPPFYPPPAPYPYPPAYVYPPYYHPRVQARWHFVARMTSPAPCDLRCGRTIRSGQSAWKREDGDVYIHDDCW